MRPPIARLAREPQGKGRCNTAHLEPRPAGGKAQQSCEWQAKLASDRVENDGYGYPERKGQHEQDCREKQRGNCDATPRCGVVGQAQGSSAQIERECRLEFRVVGVRGGIDRPQPFVPAVEIPTVGAPRGFLQLRDDRTLHAAGPDKRQDIEQYNL